MASFLRFIVGLALLPACWAIVRVLVASIMIAAESVNPFSTETISLLAGIVAFAFSWAAIGHPVRAYALGHELTHALWGLVFGARPSDVKVSEYGGSVRLTKTNFIITLAPYFFPFYTFVVIVAALITYAFLRPLPYLPLWLFLIGFTWAFHALFTLETLAQRQPDIRTYGRLFSWTIILIGNILILLASLATMTPLTFSKLGGLITERVLSAYIFTFMKMVGAVQWIFQ